MPALEQIAGRDFGRSPESVASRANPTRPCRGAFAFSGAARTGADSVGILPQRRERIRARTVARRGFRYVNVRSRPGSGALAMALVLREYVVWRRQYISEASRMP